MDRKNHWEKIYKEKSPLKVSWYQKTPTISLSLIKSLALSKADQIIDIGGGASTLVDGLLVEGFENITVLDISSNALTLSKKRLGEKSVLIDWKVEDVTKLATDRHYDLWHDRAVFHFLTEKNDREKYIKALQTSVKVGGYVIISAFSIGGPIKCSGLEIVQYDAEKLKKELGASFRFIGERTENHITPAGKRQSFGYYVFTKI